VRRCGVNAGPVVFVPACAAQCALSEGQCHYRGPTNRYKRLPQVFKRPLTKSKYPPKRACDQIHNGWYGG
jgi:hypothetical protein